MTDFAGLLDRHIPDPVRGQSFRDVLAALPRRPVVGRRGDDFSYPIYLGALERTVARVRTSSGVRPTPASARRAGAHASP